MNQLANFANRKSQIANHPMTRWLDEPMTPVEQSQIDNRQSKMARWPDDQMTRWADASMTQRIWTRLSGRV
jgi:hypothetical protein